MKTNIVIDTSLPICGKILVRNGTKWDEMSWANQIVGFFKRKKAQERS